MAFFPRTHYASSDASFTPLFRLLDDFDTYARGASGQSQNGNGHGRSSALAFQPKFDVRELDGSFELHGELPGLNKKDISIEFTDPHTLRIHGRVERSYAAGTPPAGLVQDTEMAGAITNGGEQQQQGASAPRHQASVEDDENEPATPSSTTSEVYRHQEDKKEQTQQQQQPSDKAKYWCTERSVGEFSRTFNFPGQIQQDAVSAGLVDGILTVRVPKAPKHEARRIAIN